MFQHVSKAGAGMGVVAVTAVIFSLLRFLGVEVEENAVVAVAESIFVIAGFVLTIYGQLKRKDLQYGLFRNDPQFD